MANTLTNFLIGIGYDTAQLEKGERTVNSSMESIRSNTLAIGSAMAAAAIGAGYQVDRMAEKSRKLQDQLYRTNTSTTWVQGYGASLKELGGDADDAANRVVSVENMLSALKMGDAGTLDVLSKAGFDTGYLAQAKDAQEFITRAAERFATVQGDALISQSEYRRNMAAVLQLTDAEFKLWQQGGSYVDTHSKQLAEQLGYTESLNNLQYQYSQSWVALNLELDRAGNTVSNIMLPGMTKLVGLANDYVSALTTFAQNNPREAEAAITGGSVAAAGGAAALLGKIPGLGFLRSAGPVGAAAGISIAAEPWLDRGLNSLFGDSEYFQRVRTAPTWSEFGNALIGRDGSPTSGSDYAPSQLMPDYNAYMTGNVTSAGMINMPQPPIQNKVDVQANIILDGQKVGELMDARIDDNNLTTMEQLGSQVDR